MYITEAGNVMIFDIWLLTKSEAMMLLGIWAAGALAVIALMWATYCHAWSSGYRSAAKDSVARDIPCRPEVSSDD